MSRSNFKQISLALLVAACTVLTAQAEGENRRAQLAPLPAYQQECAACHLAYPPGMLPAASWQHVMGSLDKHFGTDASLDPASAREISGWLKTNAGISRRVSEVPPQDRITKSAWFVRQHDEVSSSVWKRKAVGTSANCAACHTQATQGDFNEDNVRIPK